MTNVVKTACPLDCYDVCSVLATVKDGHITRLDGDPSHPVTQGFLCGKGRKLRDRVYAPERILAPQKRIGTNWTTISWPQAIAEIAAKIRVALNDYGHWSILHAFDWGSGAVLKNLNQRFFYQLGGCSETVGSLCWDAGLEAQRYDFGRAESHHPSDIVNAKAIVIWGRNVSNTNIHMMPFLKEATARGAKLYIVNPLPTDLDARAAYCISPRPGTDGLLAMGVLRYCMQRGWIDRTFIAAHSIGFDRYAVYIEDISLDDVSKKTDVPLEDIVKLAEIYGQNHPVATLLGIGLQRYPGGGNAIRAIDALVAATGHIGVSGGGVHYANRAIPAFFDEGALTGRAHANVREFTRGGQADEILQADPPLQVMVVTRTNPVTQVPNTARLLEAYRTIPCKIVIDMFMTETAQEADYVLPCTSVLEEEDFTFSTMWHGYATYIHPVVQPMGAAKPDWLIFQELAAALGSGIDMTGEVDSWLAAALSPLQPYGIDIATFRRDGTIELPLPAVPWADHRFLTPSQKFEFYSETAVAEGQAGHANIVEPEEIRFGDATPDLYPYALLTPHPRLNENSQRVAAKDRPQYPTIEISSALARVKGLCNDDFARVWNDRAELIGRIRIRDGGHAKTVKVESGWSGQGITINHFTRTARADFGEQTAQYDCTCELEKVTDKVNQR